MKRLLSVILLFTSPAFATETSLLGYTTQQGTKFFGIHMASSRAVTIPVNFMTAQQRETLHGCASSLDIRQAARVVVDFDTQYHSDVRSYDWSTGLPNGYGSMLTVIKSVSCAPVGIAFSEFWRTQLAKAKNQKK